MNTMELKIPPVALVLVTAAMMWLGSWLAPSFGLAVPGYDLLAIALAAMGALTSVLGVDAFRRARTTVDPMKPESSTSLVFSGVYAKTRNPMYLGFVLILLAWGVHLSNLIALLFPLLFILYMNRFQIRAEERALSSRFGEQFGYYRSRVPRWL